MSLLLDGYFLRRQGGDDSGSLEGTIGSCIRRITLATDPACIQSLHQFDTSDEFDALESDERDRRLREASWAFSLYLERIESILSNPATLPHLQQFNWIDKVPVPRSLSNSLAALNIQYLRIPQAPLEEEVENVQPVAFDKWDLRTLHGLDKYTKENAASNLGTGLLRSCSHSLETLEWCTHRRNLTFGSGPTKVTRSQKLRRLRLLYTPFSDMATVDSLLSSNLTCLDLRGAHDSLVFTALKSRGRMPCLTTLGLQVEKEAVEPCLRFLRANTQVSKLHLASTDLAPINKILPVLASSYNMLRSLRFNSILDGNPIETLTNVSRLVTIEQLCIGMLSRPCLERPKFKIVLERDSRNCPWI